MYAVVAVQQCTSKSLSRQRLVGHSAPELRGGHLKKLPSHRCHPALPQQVKAREIRCRKSHKSLLQSDLLGNHSPCAAYKRFVHVMGQTGALALTSKVLGLVREQILSTSYGLGGLADAFSITSTIPLLALSGVGGLNGAIHCAMASTCKHFLPER